MATVSTLTVVLRAQTAAFEKRMGRSRKQLSFMQRQAQATRRSLSGMFAGVIGAAGVAGITMLGKKFVEAASFAQESGNRFKEVFKLQTRAAEDFANKLAAAVGRSKTNLKDMMATLQDTFVPLGIARKKGAELSGQLVKLAIDVASFKDVADEKVLEDFTSALVGQSKAVLKYGIVLNVGALKQELLRKGIRKTFEALTTQEKVMLRFNVIMRSTKDAQGDAIRTASNHANMVKRMKSAYEELQINLGKKMIPTATKLVGVTIKAIAAIEKFNFSAAKSVIETVALTGSLAVLAKGYFALNKVIKSAVVSQFLFFGGMARLARLTKVFFAFAIGAAGGVAASFVVLGAVIGKIILQQRELTKAVKNGVEARKKQKQILERISATREALKRQENLDRLVKGTKRSQFHGALKKAEDQRLAPLIEAGKKLTEEMQSPMERFEKRIDKINDLLSEGVISWETYGRAIRDARKTLEEGPAGQAQKSLMEAGKRLTESLLTPMERFEKRLAEINKLFKAGAINRVTFGRAIAKSPEGIFPSPATSDFGVLTSPDVSIKGLSIGGAGSGINKLISQGETEIRLLTVIAAKEALS